MTRARRLHRALLALADPARQLGRTVGLAVVRGAATAVGSSVVTAIIWWIQNR